MSDPVKEYARRVFSTWGSGEFKRDKPNPANVLRSSSTRYAIVALLALEGPMTVKQISERLNMSSSAVLDHVRKLVEAGVIKEVEVPEKRYKRERYYDVDIVVYTDEDERELTKIIKKYADILNETTKAVFEKCLDELDDWFSRTLMAKHGLTLEDYGVRHFIWVSLWTLMDKYLETQGLLKDPLSTPRRWYYYVGIMSKPEKVENVES